MNGDAEATFMSERKKTVAAIFIFIYYDSVNTIMM